MTASDQWRWTDDEGVQRLLSGEELRAALRDGRLKPSVLVWKRGMANWLAAAEVAELTAAITHARPPTNMVDIARLTGSNPPPAKPAAPTPAAAMAPRHALPAAKPSGGWSSGAARRDDSEEQTVTNIRPEDRVQPNANGDRDGDNPWVRTLPKARQATLLGGTSPAARSTTTDTEVLGADGRPKTAIGLPPPPPKRSNRPPPPARPRQPSRAGPGFRSKLASLPPPRRAGIDVSARSRKPSGVIPSVRLPTLSSPGAQPAPPPSDPPARALAPIPPAPASDPAARRTPTPSADLFAAAIASRPEPAPKVRVPLPSASDDAAIERLPADIPKAPRMPQLSALELAPPREPNPSSLFDDDDDSDERAEHDRRLLARMPTEIPPSRLRRQGVLLPMPLLAALGGGSLLLLILSFVVGRASATAEAGIADAIRARTGWVAVSLFTRQQSDYGTPRPCLMARAPAQIDANASQRVPVELLALSGNRVAIGFASAPDRGRGVIYDMMSASAEVAFQPEPAAGELSRVVPVAEEDGARFEVSLKQNDGLRESVVVPADPLWTLAFKGNDVVRVATDAPASPLWKVEPAGDPADSIRAIPAGKGFAVVFRNGRQVFAGQLDAEGNSQQEPAKIWQTDGIVGRPSIGYNGRSVAVTFADLEKGKQAAVLRLARGEGDKPLGEAKDVPLPAGGPGGSVIAPAIAGLSGGRWLLMWTEGGVGNRALRAQTYDYQFRPVGQALRVSPATGSFGQGTVTVVGERAIVGFLLRTGGGFELWSTVLQCQ